MSPSPKLLCPSCRGARLVLGNPETLASVFAPKGKLMVVGFPAHRFACLDCGYLGACLSEDSRRKLVKKVEES